MHSGQFQFNALSMTWSINFEGFIIQIVQRTHLKNPWSFWMLSSLHCPFGWSSSVACVQVGYSFSYLRITEWNIAAIALSQYREN